MIFLGNISQDGSGEMDMDTFARRHPGMSSLRLSVLPLWPSEVTCLTPDKPLSFSSSKIPGPEEFIFSIGYSCAKYLAVSIIADSSNYEKSFGDIPRIGSYLKVTRINKEVRNVVFDGSFKEILHFLIKLF